MSSRSAFGIEHISKADKAPPTQDELKHRKKVSANLTLASSTLGVAGLAGLVAGKGVPKAIKAAKTGGKIGKLVPTKIKNVPQKKANRFGKKATNAAWAASTGATGIGGIGGYNYAALQRAEARKKRI